MNCRFSLFAIFFTPLAIIAVPAVAETGGLPRLVGDPIPVGSTTPAGVGFKMLDSYFGAAAGREKAFIQAAGELYARAYPLTPIAFFRPEEPLQVGEAENPVTNVHYADGRLYVSKGYNGEDREYFFVSEDAGLRFEDLTDRFVFPAFAINQYWPIQEILEDRERTYAVPNQSASLMYESTGGEWVSTLSGDIFVGPSPLGDVQSAGVHNGVVLLGNGPGALTVIHSEIWRGELDATGTVWKIPPEKVLETSNVSDGQVLGTDRIGAIAANPRSGTFFVGADGVLRSEDQGRTFDYVLGRESSSGEDSFAFIYDFLFPSVDARQVIAAGRVRKEGVPRAYLAWSTDDGRTWTDISSILGDHRWENSSAVFFLETPEGQVLVGLVTERVPGRHGLELLEIALPSAMHEFFPEARYGGQGWWEVPALGWTQGAHFPWVWVEQQGVWLYVTGTSGQNLWLWDRELGWLWTSHEVAPRFYRDETNSFLYHAPGSHSPRWFYDWLTAEWISVP